MQLRKLVVSSLAVVGLLLAGTAAKADTVLTLDAPFQIGPLSVFSFYGTITNNGDTTVYLNADSFNADAGATVDDGPFLNSPYYSLAPGQSTPDFLIFNVGVPPYGDGSNFYTGSFTLTGGADSSAGDVLASDDFNVQVTPEPGSYLLLATGLIGLAGTLRRRFTTR